MSDVKFLFAANPMVSKSWGMVLLMGIIFLILGILYFAQPIQAILALTIILGALLVFYGIEQLIVMKQAKRSGWNIFRMVLAILIGIAFLASPWFAARVIELFIGIWMIFTGVDLLAAAAAATSGTPGRGWATLNGIFSLLVGALVVIFPLFGWLFASYLIAFYLVVFGVMAITAGISLRPKKS